MIIKKLLNMENISDTCHKGNHKDYLLNIIIFCSKRKGCEFIDMTWGFSLLLKLVFLPCIYAASPPCDVSCGPPACTEPWRASARASTPPSDTQTPSSRRGCGHCWCAVETVNLQLVIAEYHNMIQTAYISTWVCVCVQSPVKDSPSFTRMHRCIPTHILWVMAPFIMADSCFFYLLTGDTDNKSLFFQAVCFSRKRNFLRSWKKRWSGQVFIFYLWSGSH